ncbi:hypothetical protein ACIP9C_02700 [Lysinibacillus sp. NPDC093210]|uniref:hypothetical protein n=1 Tax=Lysinibacillus sp. NPDC093210 TaxID=3364133 RepID=UPI0037FC5D7A
MSLIGGNLEKKEIGLALSVSGTYKNTEIDKTTGHLRLTQIDVDSTENPIYAAEGSWTSDVINLGDIFNSYEKVFTTNTMNGLSSFAVLTRVSDNGANWSDWLPLAMDGTIQSDMKQYIQVRIDLFAGFVSDVFVIAKGDFEDNPYIKKHTNIVGDYVVPKLTSNTSSQTGLAFSETIYSTSFAAWKAFSGIDNSESYVTKSGVIEGFLGFYFNNEIRINKYKVRSMAGAYLSSMPKNWVLEGSLNTTDGINGTWIELDKRSNQSWSTNNTDKEYEFFNNIKYRSYRIKWTANNGHASYTGIGALNFYQSSESTLLLKRDYGFNMNIDSTRLESGSIHRQQITRSQWISIDRLDVKRQ